MGALCLSPLSISSLLKPHCHSSSSSQSHLPIPIFDSSFSRLKSTGEFRRKRFVPRRNSKDPINNESLFLDETGGVDDMDGYLNHLSLEYDSVWDTKPFWCQPWSIALTGVSVIACSWLIWHSVVVTTVVLSLICAWWYIFLYSYPKAYAEMISERRKKVTNGVEDTYGVRKSL